MATTPRYQRVRGPELEPHQVIVRLPARLAELTYAVLFGYTVYSLIVLAFVHRAPRLAPRD